MDPNATLAALRKLCNARSDGIPEEARAEMYEEVSELFAALDHWLSHGGFLPTAWEPGRLQYAHARRTLTAIFQRMDGQEWNADTCEGIAADLRDAGFPVHDVREA